MSEPYIGEIRMFAGNYPPIGWAFCDGSVLPISGNEVLFTLIGITYGGDGQTTFALPDLRGRIPIHMGTSSLSSATYVLGQKGGTETVTVTESQLPQHTHPVFAQSADGTTTSPNNAFWATSSINQYSKSEPTSTMKNTAISSIGGNQSHNNMMPFLAVTFIIALEGMYPSLN
ncbi:microcystin-dependent protein [Aneurinibacillus soli]|uniref:Phage Tail Collar Domain protein n=1 Tax=Aneurinibacillus soli TaxID=1500254 RepID=A0A0U5AYJ3_9BACL|nr:tail fiber protein [Aneurinibacillus soli]PYE62509.1 microcystin-dependent protein [Aneurinibacillus soli]BAU27072.1 Phage Tail Collar Domain protein [Aneurinibacillus soli]